MQEKFIPTFSAEAYSETCQTSKMDGFACVILENAQTFKIFWYEHRKILKIGLAILQHYE